MIEFKEGKNGKIKVIDNFGEVLGKIVYIDWSGEYVFFSKQTIFDSNNLRYITFKLEALNAPSNNS